jgi:hypothetical protein
MDPHASTLLREFLSAFPALPLCPAQQCWVFTAALRSTAAWPRGLPIIALEENEIVAVWRENMWRAHVQTHWPWVQGILLEMTSIEGGFKRISADRKVL